MESKNRSNPINIPISKKLNEYTLERNKFDPYMNNNENLFLNKLEKRIIKSFQNHIHCSPPLFSSPIRSEFKSHIHNLTSESLISSS